jgi:cytidine deaminase
LKEEEFVIRYLSFSQRSNLSAVDHELLEMAQSAVDNAYAPYSHFSVGSAVQLTNGEILCAANQENASYGLSLCAEQNVLGTAGSSFPNQAVAAIAVTVKHTTKEIDYPISPCGACRQVIREHEVRHNHPIRIILQGYSGPIIIFETVQHLLPISFSQIDLLDLP